MQLLCKIYFNQLYSLLLAYLKFVFNRCIDIFLAPFYFHFGHYPLFIDGITILAETSVTMVLFFMALIFAIGLSLYYNKQLRPIFSNLYKTIKNNHNTVTLLSYFSTAYHSLKLSVSFLIKVIKIFFK